MALFTDGPFVTAADLNDIDGEFLSVAQANKINVDGTTASVLARYTLGAGEDFISKIQNFSGYLVGVGTASNHLAAVLNILSTAINRPRALLQQIPVTEPNPTRSSFIRWVRYYCLYDFYRNLFMRRVSEDRFRLKMLMYGEERDSHWHKLKGTGFPVVLSPFSCPGAAWDYGSGDWGSANVSSVVGSGQAVAGTQYDVVITWVSQPPYLNWQNQMNAESGGSSRQMIQLAADGNVINVNLNNLNPPSGIMNPAIGTAPGVYAPMQATGWNIYVGNVGDKLYLQNQTPILVTTTSYVLPGDPILSGYQLNAGQAAQYDFTMQNVIWRA